MTRSEASALNAKELQIIESLSKVIRTLLRDIGVLDSFEKGELGTLKYSTFGFHESLGSILVSLSKIGVRLTFSEPISIPIPIAISYSAGTRKLS